MHSAPPRRTRATFLFAALLAALLLAAVASGAASFSDPVGDNNPAPDVTAMSASESAEGTVTVSVTVSNYQSLPLDSWVNVWFDLDLNRNTGDEGDEALVQYKDDGGIMLYRWVRPDLVRRPATGITGSFAAGTLTLSVPKVALDDVAAFGVLAVGVRSQDDGDGDELLASDLVPDKGRARYASPGPLSIADPVGDHDAAPDIAAVEVSDTKAGMISVAVSTPSHPTLARDTWVELDVDIDRRRSTGGGGAEAYVLLDGGRVYAGRWNPDEEEFVPVRGSGVRARSAGGVVTFVLPRRFLDDVVSFDYYVISGDSSLTGDEDYAIDLAPDGDAWWKYRLVNRAQLRLIAGAPGGTPRKPVAGRLFTVTVPVKRSDTARGVTSGKVVCDVRIAGKKVQASGRLASGKGVCSILVPETASGRVLRGSLMVHSSGKSITARFSFPVR